MKLPLLTSALVALGAVFSAQPAQAIYTTTSTSNDLILSFFESNDPNVFQVDLGNVSNFMGLPTFTALNLNPDLTNIFGANYYTDSNLLFSVAGTNSTSKNVFISTSTATPFDPKALGGLSNISKNIAVLYTNYGSAATSGATPNSDILPLATVNNIRAARGTGTFGGLSNADGAAPEASFGSLLPPTLGLNVLTTGTSTEVVDALGTPYVFSISPAGILTYTATDAQVPEPSTYALMLAGAFGVLFIARRKSLASL